MINLMFYPVVFFLLLPSLYLGIFNIGNTHFFYVVFAAFLILGIPLVLFIQLYFKIIQSQLGEMRKNFLITGTFLGIMISVFYTVATMVLTAILNNFQVLFTVADNFYLQSIREVLIVPLIYDAIQAVFGSFFVMLIPGIIIGGIFGYALAWYIDMVYQMDNLALKSFFLSRKAPAYTYYMFLFMIYVSFLYLANYHF